MLKGGQHRAIEGTRAPKRCRRRRWRRRPSKRAVDCGADMLAFIVLPIPSLHHCVFAGDSRPPRGSGSNDTLAALIVKGLEWLVCAF